MTKLHSLCFGFVCWCCCFWFVSILILWSLKNFEVSWLLCRRWIYIFCLFVFCCCCCFSRSCYNPLWLIGLKAPTNYFWHHEIHLSRWMLRSWFSKTKHFVLIYNHQSPLGSFDCHVLQSSVLCRILFKLYIAPLTCLKNSNKYSIGHEMFADDT